MYSYAQSGRGFVVSANLRSTCWSSYREHDTPGESRPFSAKLPDKMRRQMSKSQLNKRPNMKYRPAFMNYRSRASILKSRPPQVAVHESFSSRSSRMQNPGSRNSLCFIWGFDYTVTNYDFKKPLNVKQRVERQATCIKFHCIGIYS